MDIVFWNNPVRSVSIRVCHFNLHSCAGFVSSCKPFVYAVPI